MNQEQPIVKVFNVIRNNADKINEIVDPNKAVERISELNDYIATAEKAIADVKKIVVVCTNVKNYIIDNDQVINKAIPDIQKFSNVDLTLKWIENLEQKSKDLKSIIEKIEVQILNLTNAINKIQASKIVWEEELRRIKTQYSL